MLLNCGVGEDSWVAWTARSSNQSILEEINLEYSLEGLMLKLKLQYFGHLMWRADSLENPDAGKDWRQEEEGTTEDEMFGWHHQLNGHEFEQALGDCEGQGILAWCSPRGSERVGHDWVTKQQQQKGGGQLVKDPAANSEWFEFHKLGSDWLSYVRLYSEQRWKWSCFLWFIDLDIESRKHKARGFSYWSRCSVLVLLGFGDRGSVRTSVVELHMLPGEGREHKGSPRGHLMSDPNMWTVLFCIVSGDYWQKLDTCNWSVGH